MILYRLHAYENIFIYMIILKIGIATGQIIQIYLFICVHAYLCVESTKDLIKIGNSKYGLLQLFCQIWH